MVNFFEISTEWFFLQNLAELSTCWLDFQVYDFNPTELSTGKPL